MNYEITIHEVNQPKIRFAEPDCKLWIIYQLDGYFVETDLINKLANLLVVDP